MNYLPYLIAILACVVTLMLSIYVAFFIKHRRGIFAWIKRNLIVRFFIMILMPFIFPLIVTFMLEFGNVNNEFIIRVEDCNCEQSSECVCEQEGTYQLTEKAQKTVDKVSIALYTASGICSILLFIEWIKEHKESNIRWKNEAAKIANNNFHRILMDKNTRIKGAYHHGLKHGMLSDADIPYNIFSQIRSICWEFCSSISQITHIEMKDMNASFIYHYCYKGATKNDQKWRWVTGKGTKFNENLDEFVHHSNSTFHNLVYNNISTIFRNDKKKAEAKGEYVFSYRDNAHKRKGSFFAAKVVFSGNDGACCEGIIVIHSYKFRFLDKIKRATEEELSELITDHIFPCYRHLIQTELAMLYFRHQTEDDEKDENEFNKQEASEYPRPMNIDCTMEINKKVWKVIPSENGTKY